MTRDLLLSQTVAGFLLARAADGYAPATLAQYKWALDKITAQVDGPLSALSTDDLRRALAAVQAAGDLGPQSFFHVWKSIRALFKWTQAEGLTPARPDLLLQRPRFQSPQVQPFTADELRLLLKATDRTRPSAGRRAPFSMQRATRWRDRAVLLVLLDAGLRASELSRLELRDLDLQSGAVTVRPHQSGLKSRGRVIPLGKSARTALWRYHAERGELRPTDPVFESARGAPLNKDSLLHLLLRLGERAGVAGVHPHRFRHTFAVQFLRNGGDVFTLQRLLGHASLDMVRHYLALAQADDETAHRRASPVDNWRLS
jgi:integrase/recombinase XerD